MTCIAYHYADKQVAIDSRLNRGGVISTDDYNKTIKNKHGLWLFSGALSDYSDLSKLIHNDKVSVTPNCCAFLINGDGVNLVTVTNDGYCEYSLLKYSEGLGSGGNFALAAMDFGKSAKEAVKYAMTRDVYTGGRVRVFNV